MQAIAAVGSPIQDAGVKRHHRGCICAKGEYIMFVSQNQTKTPSCSTADICSRYGVPRLSIETQTFNSCQFNAVGGLSASNSALACRTYSIAMAETVHNDTRISERELTGSTSYEQEQVQTSWPDATVVLDVSSCSDQQQGAHGLDLRFVCPSIPGFV